MYGLLWILIKIVEMNMKSIEGLNYLLFILRFFSLIMFSLLPSSIPRFPQRLPRQLMSCFSFSFVNIILLGIGVTKNWCSISNTTGHITWEYICPPHPLSLYRDSQVRRRGKTNRVILSNKPSINSVSKRRTAISNAAENQIT